MQVGAAWRRQGGAAGAASALPACQARGLSGSSCTLSPAASTCCKRVCGPEAGHCTGSITSWQAMRRPRGSGSDKCPDILPGRRRSAGCVLCAADSPPAAARPAPARPAKTRAAGAFCARVSARASKRQTGALAASPASSVTGQAKAASSRSMPASRAAQHSCCPPLCAAVQKRRRLHGAAQAGRARRRKRPAPARGPPVRWPPACGGALKTEANSES